MKRYAKLTFLVLFFLGNLYFSQGFAGNIGYNYIGKSAGYLGVDYRITDQTKATINVGVGTYLTSVNHKFGFVPELHFNQMIGKDSGLMYQLSASPKNLKPSIGLNILNLLHLDFGYSFGFNKSKDFQGFAMGLNFFLGQDSFYDPLKGF